MCVHVEIHETRWFHLCDVMCAQVEIQRWTGVKLALAAAHSDTTRLVTSLTVIKNQYVLAGNLQRGLAFLQSRDAASSLTLLAREFAEVDAIAVEFMLAGVSLAFVRADPSGSLALFNYQRDSPEARAYEPPGIMLAPLGHYHVGHKVRTFATLLLRACARAARRVAPCFKPCCTVRLAGCMLMTAFVLQCTRSASSSPLPMSLNSSTVVILPAGVA